MFGFCLAATEMAFRHGRQMVWKAQLAREKGGLPLTRGDMLAEGRIFIPALQLA